jgi:hypothetical protein
MALNPAFATHGSRKLPLAFGYVLGSGDQAFSTIAPDNSRYAYFLMGEGEWDGLELIALFDGAHLLNGYVGRPGLPSDFATHVHFHSGQWSIKGLGTVPTSAGICPVNCYDGFFLNFPTTTPPQCFSGICYVGYYLPGTVTIPFGTHQQGETTAVIAGLGVWRSTRCRTFDANGNFVSYTFTCNPAWLIVEAILRYKIKPQQPPIAGLNAAEKACFNWPSVVAFAARNDFILPNGNPRFFWSGLFASDTTLTNILETLLRCSRAYMRVTNGQIYLIGDDSRDPVFTVSANHLVPNSLKLSKKNVSKAPNQFVPKYRDVDMPAVTQVVSATKVTLGSDPDQRLAIESQTLSPFLANDFVTYGGATDPSFDGVYQVMEPESGGAPAAYVPYYTYCGQVPSGSATSTTGGYLGTNDARFSERAPTGVQHRSHQKIRAPQMPGLSALPRITPVYYDMGNSTFDQTNRIMKFERDSSLGPDIGADWVAPIAGTLKVYLEAVDAAGNYFKDVNEHDVITLDDWATPEFAGQYVVQNKTITAPTGDELAMVELDLMQYYADAYTDVSDPPGDAYATVPGTTFQLTGFTPVVNPAWTLIATPIGVLSGSGSSATWTITIPNLVMQIGGVAGTTAYPAFSVAGIPNGTPVVLYIDDPGGDGVGATYGFAAGTALTAPPAGRWIVLIGTFTNVFPFNVTPGDPSVLFEPA